MLVLHSPLLLHGAPFCFLTGALPHLKQSFFAFSMQPVSQLLLQQNGSSLQTFAVQVSHEESWRAPLTQTSWHCAGGGGVMQAKPSQFCPGEQVHFAPSQNWPPVHCGLSRQL